MKYPSLQQQPSRVVRPATYHVQHLPQSWNCTCIIRFRKPTPVPVSRVYRPNTVNNAVNLVIITAVNQAVNIAHNTLSILRRVNQILPCINNSAENFMQWSHVVVAWQLPYTLIRCKLPAEAVPMTRAGPYWDTLTSQTPSVWLANGRTNWAQPDWLIPLLNVLARRLVDVLYVLFIFCDIWLPA